VPLTLTPTGTPGARVSDAMFGANTLAHINTINEGLDRTIGTFGISTIRWPGGSVSENHFDPKNPDVPLPVSRDPDEKSVFKDTVMTFTDTMQWAAANKTGISLVIPTRHLLTDKGTIDPQGVADMRAFLTDVLAKGGKYADAAIASIEIGNEYWGTQLTAAQYGAIANTLVGVIDAVITATKPAVTPQILVQQGTAYGVDNLAGGQYAHLSWGDKIRQANADIIAQLSPESKAKIDGAISHFYYVDRDANMGHHTSDPWSERMVQDMWRKAGLADSVHFTEWNVRMRDGIAAGEPNFAAGGILIEQFEIMMRMNPGAAYIWPVNQSTNNDLAGPTNSDPGKLSINGAAFKLLSDHTRGMAYQEMNVEADARFESSLYTSPTAAVVFISESAGKTLADTLDLRALLPAKPPGTRLVVTIEEITRDESMDPFVGKGSGARITKVFEGSTGHLGAIPLHLSPYEIAAIRIEWVAPPAIRDTKAALVTGTAREDVLIAGHLHQHLQGGGGDDLIRGAHGHNSLRGNAGHDSITGEGGNDSLFGDDGHDTLDGGVGNDTLYGGTGNDSLVGGAGEDRLYGEIGNDLVWGDAGGDNLYGGAGHDMLYGGQHTDRLFGDEGNDTLWGGTHNDSLYGGVGNDSLNGEDGNDQIWGEAGNDLLRGGTGHDALYGGDGNDRLWGGAHNDTLYGGTGNDQLWGDDGTDRLYGDTGNDVLYGGAGNDVLTGGGDHDRLFGQAGNDVLYGDAGNDILVGGGNTNTLYGGAGNDTFYFGHTSHAEGRAATSYVRGGTGKDLFVFSGTSGWTGIQDFENGIDKIRFSDPSVKSMADLDISAHGGGKNTLITYDGGTLRLDGTPMAHIDATDFQF